MGTVRQSKSTADYAAIAVAPVLIFILISSLANFFMLILYRGQYSFRVAYVLLLYTMGAVAVARIAIEQDRNYSLTYLAALGMAAFAVMARFIPGGAIFCAMILAAIAYLADRIVHDCTLIDDNLDASGQGLIDFGHDVLEKETRNVKHTQEPDDDSTVDIRKKNGHQPGRTVLYLAFGALPLFGIGQFLMRGDMTTWGTAQKYLALYLFSSLSLLVTTSFLGLRRYLRQRQVDMPHDVTVAWIAGGLVSIGLILGLAYLAPMPGQTLASIEMPEFFKSADDLSASRAGWGNEGANQSKPQDKKIADEKSKSESDSNLSKKGAPPGKADGGDSKKGPTSQQDGGKKSGGSKKPEAKNNGQQNQKPNQSGPKQKNSSQSQGKQSQAKSNQSSSRKDGQRNAPKDQGKANQAGEKKNSDNENREKNRDSNSNNNQERSKQQNQQAEKQENSSSNQSESDPSAKEPNQEQQQSSQEQKEQEQKQKQDREAKNQEADSTSRPPEPKSAQDSSSSLSNSIGSLFSALGAIIKPLMFIALAAVVAVYVYLHRDALLEWWNQLWNRDSPTQESFNPIDSPSETDQSARTFASFSNPIGRERDPRRVIVITFQAFEAWMREQGWKREPDETPSEFLRRTQSEIPNAAPSVGRIIDAYNRVVYGRGATTKEELAAADRLWQTMTSA